MAIGELVEGKACPVRGEYLIVYPIALGYLVLASNGSYLS